MNHAGDKLSAHLSLLAGGVLDGTWENEIGLTGAAEAKLNEQFSVKVAALYVDPNTGVIDDDGTELGARLEYALTEKLALAAEAGHLFTGAAAPGGTQGIADGLLEPTWKPGADFEASTAFATNTLGAHKVSFTASRRFHWPMLVGGAARRFPCRAPHFCSP